MKEREFANVIGRMDVPDGLRQRVLGLKQKPQREMPFMRYAVPAALAVILILGSAVWLRSVTEPRVPALASASEPIQSAVPRTAQKASPMKPYVPESQGQAGAVHPTPSRPTRPPTGKKTVFLSVMPASYGGVGKAMNLAQNQTTAIQAQKITGSLDGGKGTAVLFRIPLHCVGDGISKVVFELNRGTLEQAVPLTKEQAQNPAELKQKGLEPLTEPADGAGSQEEPYFGFHPLGNSQTITNYKGNDTGFLAVKYVVSAESALPASETSEFQKLLAAQVNGTNLKITATFEEGAICEKNVTLSSSTDGNSIQATLLD